MVILTAKYRLYEKWLFSGSEYEKGWFLIYPTVQINN